MKPKEKAIELVDFYNSILINYIQNEFERKYVVMECGIIAVNYVIFANPHSNPLPWNPAHSDIKYWLEVKKEIELL